MFSNVDILPRIVRYDGGLAVDICPNDRENSCRFQVIKNHDASTTGIVIDPTTNFIVVSVSAAFLDTPQIKNLVLYNEDFVHLHDPAPISEESEATVAHGLAQTVRHKPGGIELDA